MNATKLSSKDRILLPGTVRKSKARRPGQVFTVECTPHGVLLKPIAPLTATRLEDVVGSAGYVGPRRSLAEMDVAIANEALRTFKGLPGAPRFEASRKKLRPPRKDPLR